MITIMLTTRAPIWKRIIPFLALAIKGEPPGRMAESTRKATAAGWVLT